MVAGISEADVIKIPDRLSADMTAVDRERLKHFLAAMVSRVTADPANLTWRITTRSRPLPGNSWRPHGDSNPGYRRERAMS
jgi:hypothetical protein